MLRILDAIINFVFSVFISLAAILMLFILPPVGLLFLFFLGGHLRRSTRPARQVDTVF